MAIQWKARWGIVFLLLPLAGGGAWAAAAASPPTAGTATRPTTHSSQALPAALRPVFYQALAKDAGATYGINKNGCAVLAKQNLKACFDAHGAHFTGATPVSLHLVAFGRSGKLISVGTVRPTFRDNQVNYAHGNLTAWWRVLPLGFEQGFTVAKRPSGHGKLTLALAASRQDAGAPGGKGALAWGKLRYGKLMVTDANGKVMSATLTSEGNRVLIAVNDADAAYPLTVDPLVWLEQKVTPSDDGDDLFEFGSSVAIDGTTALVGAPGAGTIGQGVIYVFSESNGSWVQTAKLTPSDGIYGDFFGASVALDGNTALVGAYNYAVNGEPHQGKAYVFTRSNGNWMQTQELTVGDASYFGSSVALNGTTALVGAPYTYIGGIGEGAVYVYTESNGVWTQTQRLTPSPGIEGAGFGWSVALNDTTALVGARGADVTYVFTNSGGTWSQTQGLFSGHLNDAFGTSVALDGATALIGAPYTTVCDGSWQGAAYVFTKSGNVWNQAQQLVACPGIVGEGFGSSVALSGATALVGVPEGPGIFGGGGPGATYVFTNSGGTWVQSQKLTASDGVIGDSFGSSVAIDGATSLVGAPLATFNGDSIQGAAYFYGKSDLGLAVSAPDTVGQGEQYTSQTIATNNASTASPAVAATITVPAAASFVSATASQGSCNEDSGVVTCDFGQIPGNAGMAAANVTLTATGAPGTTIHNIAGFAKATPALTSSAPTTIGEGGACQAGYTEFDGHLDAGQTFTSAPITVTESGQKYMDLTSPASFAFFAITNTHYGQHTYVYSHAKHGHRWGAAGSYQVGVQAGATGGDYTLCVNLNPAQ